MAEPGSDGNSTPFLELDRADWAALAPVAAHPLAEAELEQLRGIGDLLDPARSRRGVRAAQPADQPVRRRSAGAAESTTAFLGQTASATPFVIGVAGSVAVGKSTIARLLGALLARWEDTPRVELVTTDGFLLPNAELERRGLLQRKGFPESYDRRALLRFVSRVKSGAAEVPAPVYSHLSYDIVPDEQILVQRPDVLIVEGLNVLQPPAPGSRLAVSDLFDFTIYVDARTSDIERWYVDRFLRLQRGAFADPQSYFHRYAELSEEDAIARAKQIWREINGPNLEQNILPTRARASLVLRKGSDHSVASVLLRKV
jgi:type I pantothenate kinase